MYICIRKYKTRRKKKIKGSKDSTKMTLRRNFILPSKQTKFTKARPSKRAATTFSSIKDKALIAYPASRMIWVETAVIKTSSMSVRPSQTKEVPNLISTATPTSLLKKSHLLVKSLEKLATILRKETPVSKKSK